MLSPSVNTSPVELSYTFLEMVASKRRNHPKPENLETLLLLLALQVPVRLFFVINLKSSIWKHRLQNFIFKSTVFCIIALYQKLPNSFSFVSIKQVLFRKGDGVVFETGF